MIDLFRSSYLKIGRAKEHMLSAEQEIARWPRPKPEDLDIWLEGVTSDNKPIVRWNFKFPLPNLDKATLLFGDAMHNLRSALDHMATEIASRRANKPVKASFPFAGKEEELDRMIRDKGFAKCGDDCVALLKTLQPYAGGNQLLCLINEIDVIDKHRHLPVVGGLGKAPQFRVNVDAEGKHHLFKEHSTPPIVATLGSEDGPDILHILEDGVKLVESIIEQFAALIRS